MRELQPLAPHHLPLAPRHLLQAGRAGPGITSMGELNLSFTSYSTHDTGSCNIVELTLWIEAQVIQHRKLTWKV